MSVLTNTFVKSVSFTKELALIACLSSSLYACKPAPHSDSNLQGVISATRRADDHIAPLSLDKIKAAAKRLTVKTSLTQAGLSEEKVRASLLRELLSLIVENHGIRVDDLRKILRLVVEPKPDQEISMARIFGYDASQAELPLLELADAVAAKIREVGFKDPYKMIHQTLEVEDVRLQNPVVENAVRSALRAKFPYIQWEDRPLRKLSVNEVKTLSLTNLAGRESLEDLPRLSGLQTLQVKVHNKELVDHLARMVPRMKNLRAVFLGTDSRPARARLGDMAELGKLPQIKTLGLNTGFAPSTWDRAQLEGVWAHLPELFPHVETMVLSDTWAISSTMRQRPGQVNENLRIAVQAVNRMKSVHTFELHSATLGRQIDSLPHGLKFKTVRLAHNYPKGRHPLEVEIDIPSLSRPFGSAKSLSIANFIVRDSGSFSGPLLKGPSGHTGKVLWEELILIACQGKKTWSGAPLSIKLWPKDQPELTSIHLMDSRDIKVDPESQSALRMRRPENVAQAVIHKRNQDLLDKIQEEKILQDFIDSP